MDGLRLQHRLRPRVYRWRSRMRYLVRFLIRTRRGLDSEDGQWTRPRLISLGAWIIDRIRGIVAE